MSSMSRSTRSLGDAGWHDRDGASPPVAWLMRVPLFFGERLLVDGEVASQAAEDAANAAFVDAEAIGNFVQRQPLATQAKEGVVLCWTGRQHALPQFIGAGGGAWLRHARLRKGGHVRD